MKLTLQRVHYQYHMADVLFSHNYATLSLIGDTRRTCCCSDQIVDLDSREEFMFDHHKRLVRPILARCGNLTTGISYSCDRYITGEPVWFRREIDALMKCR